MSSVLLQAILLASSGLFSVGSITLVILLLLSKKGWQNGLCYALGYVSGYTIIGIIILLLNYQTSETTSTEPNMLFPVFLVIFGSVLIWLAIHNWMKPVQNEKKENRFFAMVDKITPVKAFTFGLVVTVINVKNLALFLSALSLIVQSGLPITDKLFIMVISVFVFCLSVIIPLGIYILFPHHRNDLLNGIRNRLEHYSRPISIWIPITFGSILLVMGVSSFLN